MPLSETQRARRRETAIGFAIAIGFAGFVVVVTLFELMLGAGESPEAGVAMVVPVEDRGDANSDTVSLSQVSPDESSDTLEAGSVEATELSDPLGNEEAIERAPPQAASTETEPASDSSSNSFQGTLKPAKTPKKRHLVMSPAEEEDEDGLAAATEAVGPDVEADADEKHSTLPHESISLRGRVVWLNEVLQRQFKIATPDDAREQMVALVTADGEIVPIVEDTRGRAFRLDDRLRNRPVEILARRYQGSPMVQVIRLYAVREDGHYELDYWCDICAIQMFQHGVCDCCQGDNRLRERKIEAGE